MSFGEVMEASGVSFLASQMSGILGLGYSTISVDKLPTWMDQAPLTDKSFSFYLHNNPEASYMVIPGWDSTNFATIDTHKVVEQAYWSLNLTAIGQGSKKYPQTGMKAVIDSGTSLIVGTPKVIDPIIANIQVLSDCSNVKSLPQISFTIDSQTYPLDPVDYVIKVTQGDQTQCMMGVATMNFPSTFNYVILGDVFMRKYPSYFSLNDNTVSFQVAK